MSNASQPPLAQNNSARPGGLRGRLPYYIGAVLVGILALAYFDGGEEPIRPIVEAVAMPGSGSESE